MVAFTIIIGPFAADNKTTRNERHRHSPTIFASLLLLPSLSLPNARSVSFRFVSVAFLHRVHVAVVATIVVVVVVVVVIKKSFERFESDCDKLCRQPTRPSSTTGKGRKGETLGDSTRMSALACEKISGSRCLPTPTDENLA